MYRAMHRFVIPAALAVVAAASAGCSSEGAGSRSATAPSPVSAEAKPGTGSSTNSSLALQMVNDANANGAPNWGDSVTFQVSTSATTEPHVDLKCSQGGVLVYSATTGYYASYPWPWTQTMTLRSNAWQGGQADCAATLYYFAGRKTPVLATYRFTAEP